LGLFEIIAGERRWRAAKLAGLQDIDCLVRNLTDSQVLHAQVIENLQRDDLPDLEEAEGDTSDCWGFIGYNDEESGLKAHLDSTVEWLKKLDKE